MRSHTKFQTIKEIKASVIDGLPIALGQHPQRVSVQFANHWP